MRVFYALYCTSFIRKSLTSITSELALILIEDFMNTTLVIQNLQNWEFLG